MRVLVIAIVLLTSLFGFFLKYLTYSKLNSPIPDNVKDIYDEEGYAKNQRYLKVNMKFSIIGGLVGLAISLALLLFNVHSHLFDYISGFTTNFYLTGLFIMVVPIIAESIIDLLFDIYDTFVIEARFGFNKTTVKTFIADLFKGLAIAVIIGGGLLLLFMFLYDTLGDMVFLVFFFILIGFTLFMTFISPLLLRIFYKLTPLEDGELKTKIEDLVAKTGYNIKGIYMVDASRRSTKLNAFASGFGKTKTIGLFDTLIEKMTTDEIVAILAHEIGHAKKHHILKSAPLSLLIMGIMCFAAFFIVTQPVVSQAFGFAEANIVFGVYIMAILLSPLMMILNIPSSALSRKHEYEADAYEKELVGKEAPISAMKKLYREDLGNLTPHPFVVMMSHSHPTASQRIAAFERDD